MTGTVPVRAALRNEILSAAVELVVGSRAILGIAGAPGAGKTTFAQLLVDTLCEVKGAGWAAHLPMDGFHIGDRQLARLGLIDRKGAPDTFDADGYAATLARVRSSVDAVFVPGFDRGLEQPIAADMVIAPDAQLVVTEGNYLLLPEPRWRMARACLDQVWFVTGSDSLRRERLVARHVEFGKTPALAAAWVASVDQPNAEQVLGSASRADRMVSNDGSHFSLRPKLVA